MPFKAENKSINTCENFIKKRPLFVIFFDLKIFNSCRPKKKDLKNIVT
jgi:hypothetical protein